MGGVKWTNKLESLDMLSTLLTLTIYFKKFVEEVDFMSPFLSHQTEGSLDSLTLPQILSFFSSPWQKHGETFSESEVPLRYHLWGMKVFFFFLTCLEWFQHIQASSWQGHKPVNLPLFPLFPRALLTSPFSFSTSPSKEVQLYYFYFLSLTEFCCLCVERDLLFSGVGRSAGEKKSIAITSWGNGEKDGERWRVGGRGGGCSPCQSDPAWRLSSPLIASLISSPLSLDLGQPGLTGGCPPPPISATLCPLFFPPSRGLSPPGLSELDLKTKKHRVRIWRKYIDRRSELTPCSD